MQKHPTSCYKIFLSLFISFAKTFRDSEIPCDNNLPTKARCNYILRDPTDANRNFFSPLFYPQFHPDCLAGPDSRQLSFVTRHCHPSLCRECWSGAQWPPPTRKWSTTATTGTMIRSRLHNRTNQSSVNFHTSYKSQVATRSNSKHHTIV